MSKARLTVTLDQDVMQTLVERCAHEKSSRSQFVENILRDWQRNCIREQLVDGYRTMSGEDATTAEERLAAGSENME